MEEKGVKKTVRIMVVGIPNVGKSTFINRIAGENRAKTPEAGRPGRLPLRILRTEKMGTTRFSYIK